MPWNLETARQLGLIGASFFTQSGADNTVNHNIHEGQGQESGSECSSLLTLFVDQFSNFREADWIFLNTFNTLEEEMLPYFQSGKLVGKPKVRTNDPIILVGQTAAGRQRIRSKSHQEQSGRLHGDSKETGSVVYVSFGSLAALGGEQMAEVDWGLKRSDCYFLLVVRESE
ncbi:hypothetical protein SADUNF_Sadunf05G0191200 [Salix dunnii]|uniref:Uncharacterized protein n=1 Tax=Salix dunnii TaxID=1413687 RepID=A0A835KC96_9ROSI|nr:hypothetical protein SADUNF_Sadunf05G0191200 [Salix dunnii]